MAEREAFRVAVKQSAVAANEAAEALAAEHGKTLAFDSRAAAEAEAARLSRRGETSVAIQGAAPQEADGIDAYLVASPERRTHEPVERGDGRLTFETTAVQYGALGEALVCSYGANPPVLLDYARREADLPGDLDDRLWIDVDADPAPVIYAGADGAERLAWVPDCVAIARDGPGGPVLAEYACEVKTGDASFQRDQAAVMAYEARERDVLKVRVDVDGLPDEYTVRVDAVAPEEPPEGVANRAAPDARLDDFA